MIQQRKIAKYVLLQIVTLGIYGLFFWSDWTEDLNKMCEDDDKESANYILVFLLDIFSFGVYSFVWNYTHSERMYRIAPKYGIELKHGGSYILLLRLILFFLPVVGSVEKIKLFNTLAVAYNSTLDEEAILLETMKEQKSKKEAKADKKAQKKAEKAEKKNAKANKEVAPVIVAPEEDVIDITNSEAPIIEIPAPNAKEEKTEYLTEENAPVYFEAPKFETVEPEAVVEIPVVEEPVIEEAIVEVPQEAEVEFTEPVYEIADIEIPNLNFAEASVEVEEVTELQFTEPAAYEVSTDIADVTFIDDENLVPASKEDVLKQATKTVGTKRTVKEKVSKETEAKEPVAKKATKTAADKATKSTKEKNEAATKATKSTKDTATKSTTKKETAKKETKPKTTKAQKEKAKKEVEKLAEEVKIEEVTFNDITFEEVDLGADILNEIAEISKSKK